jgi:hypothetical protein
VHRIKPPAGLPVDLRDALTGLDDPIPDNFEGPLLPSSKQPRLSPTMAQSAADKPGAIQRMALDKVSHMNPLSQAGLV